jgi:G3E family GTPase
LSWNHVEAELGALTQRFGERLLRVKGLLVIEGIDGAVRVDAVQGLFYRPEVLSQNLHGDPISRLVAIAQGIDEGILRRALAALLDRSAAHEVVRMPA